MLRVAGCPFAESCKRIVAYNINECYPKYVSIKIRQKKKKNNVYVWQFRKYILNFEALNF